MERLWRKKSTNYTKTMFLTDDHKAIRPLFEVELGKI
jgi:hypothetical protein